MVRTKMGYYGTNDYRDYLAHHGVVGMKWGIRRYQPYSSAPRGSGKNGKEIGEAAKKKTGIIRRAQIRLGYNRQKTVNRYINTARAKGIVNKASAFAGHTYQQKKNESNVRMHQRLAEASRTKLGKAYHNQKAANSSYKAQYHKIRKSLPRGERIASRLIYNGTYAKMPYQRLSGRTTTIGKEMLNGYLTAGTVGLYKDIKYLRSKKNGK